MDVAPSIPGKASVKKYNSSVVTEFKLFEGCGYSIASDHGWKEVAECPLA